MEIANATIQIDIVKDVTAYISLFKGPPLLFGLCAHLTLLKNYFHWW